MSQKGLKHALDLDVFSDEKRPVYQVYRTVPLDATGDPADRPSVQPLKDIVIGHGQNGKGVLQRIETISTDTKARLRNISLFILPQWEGPGGTPEWVQREFCDCLECIEYGLGLQPRLMKSLRSLVNPNVSIRLHYHLRFAVKLLHVRLNYKVGFDDPMLSLLKNDSGFSGCKTLVIVCFAGHDYERAQLRRDESFDRITWPGCVEEWESLCQTVATIIWNGSSLEHLEIWIPRCPDLAFPEAGWPGFKLEKMIQELSDAEVAAVPRHYKIYFEESLWVHFLTEIWGLRSVEICLREHNERTSQQSCPVTELPLKGFREYLESEMVTKM
ncbi:MAG: hypothetical protein Q9218_001967 [Villophora microphyllina]